MTALRYNNISVILHWLVAIMLIMALFMGSTALVALPNDDPEKINALKGHMIFGFLITTFMIVRLIVKLKSINPPHMNTGNALQDKLGVSVHHILYVLVILMGLSGFGTAVLAGVPEVIQGVEGASLPETFNDLLPRLVHGIIAKLLIAIVALHFLAALYHQLILKDNIMARMKFGKRFED
ncbi:MAG: cytochrome b/b6 domain-containing protein [Gammaproteobacteria bacterium]|nr:cytochrome b/b6 domain-containing protein [Gammaproteobacteria bacterium]